MRKKGWELIHDLSGFSKNWHLVRPILSSSRNVSLSVYISVQRQSAHTTDFKFLGQMIRSDKTRLQITNGGRVIQHCENICQMKANT